MINDAPVNYDVYQGICKISTTGNDNDIPIVLTSSFILDTEENIIAWENLGVPMCLYHSDVLGYEHSTAILLQIINQEENASVIHDDEEVSIPRRFVGSWYLHDGIMNSVSEEEVATASNLHFETGELLVPEEGMDYFSTTSFPFINREDEH